MPTALKSESLNPLKTSGPIQVRIAVPLPCSMIADVLQLSNEALELKNQSEQKWQFLKFIAKELGKQRQPDIH